MRLLRWAIVIVGVSFVSLASIVPKVDAQETAYDETDSPINLTTPFVARTNFVAPVGHPVAIPRERQGWWKPAAAMSGVTLKPKLRASYCLLNLLCELLC
jgi:hypothetical protein